MLLHPAAYPSPLHKIKVEQIQARYARRGAIRWGITLKGEDRVLGSCGFHHFDEGFHRAETGYELHRALWGQGVMTEAMSAILIYGFDYLGLHCIEAIIDMANERSKGLLLKLGFIYEGNLRQRYSFRDHFEDEHYFGLLRDEWPRPVYVFCKGKVDQKIILGGSNLP